MEWKICHTGQIFYIFFKDIFCNKNLKGNLRLKPQTSRGPFSGNLCDFCSEFSEHRENHHSSVLHSRLLSRILNSPLPPTFILCSFKLSSHQYFIKTVSSIVRVIWPLLKAHEPLTILLTCFNPFPLILSFK